MSTQTMEQIIGHVLTDVNFRKAFEKDKEQALEKHAHDLTNEERTALQRLTYEKVQAFVQQLVEPMDRTDYAVGSMGIAVGIAVLLGLVYLYWQLHGGEVETFRLWSMGDARWWLEIVFWSAFVALSRAMFGIGYEMGVLQQFQKRRLPTFLGGLFQNSVLSLAAVMVLLNLGISLGDLTLSLKATGMEFVIALTIITTVFAQQTGDFLASIFDRVVDAARGTMKKKKGER